MVLVVEISTPVTNILENDFSKSRTFLYHKYSEIKMTVQENYNNIHYSSVRNAPE